MIRRIRIEKVVDCPKENRIVPITAIQAGADHNQFTCRKCQYHGKDSCYSLRCDYPVTKSPS
jgi:hypothetical protein